MQSQLASRCTQSRAAFGRGCTVARKHGAAAGMRLSCQTAALASRQQCRRAMVRCQGVSKLRDSTPQQPEVDAPQQRPGAPLPHAPIMHAKLCAVKWCILHAVSDAQRRHSTLHVLLNIVATSALAECPSTATKCLNQLAGWLISAEDQSPTLAEERQPEAQSEVLPPLPQPAAQPAPAARGLGRLQTTALAGVGGLAAGILGEASCASLACRMCGRMCSRMHQLHVRPLKSERRFCDAVPSRK